MATVMFSRALAKVICFSMLDKGYIFPHLALVAVICCVFPRQKTVVYFCFQFCQVQYTIYICYDDEKYKTFNQFTCA